MCLSSMQDDSTSHSWNLASKDKCSSVIFDRLLYFRVSIFVQISRNKLGQKKYQAALVSLVLEQRVTATVPMIAAVPGLLEEKMGLSVQKQTHTGLHCPCTGHSGQTKRIFGGLGWSFVCQCIRS